MSNDSNSLTEEQLKPIQAAQVAPGAENIAALIKKEGRFIGDITVSGIQRPELGGSAGSLGFKARVNEGNGYHTKDFFIRFQSMGDNAFKNYDLPAQFRTMQILAKTDVPVPNVLYLDADGDTLGTPGFIMEKLEGSVPADVYRTGLFAEASPDSRRAMVFEVVHALARLHNLDWQSLGFDFLVSTGGAGSTFLEHEINRSWENICWGCPERIPEAGPLYLWLMENQPRDSEIVLNHGDANYTNFMFNDDKLVAVLDWEFAFPRPRECDLAFLLLVTDILTIGQTPSEGFPGHEEILAEYERVSGYQLRHWDFAYKLACFTVAVRLWVGIRFFPPERQKELEVRPNYCLNKFYANL